MDDFTRLLARFPVVEEDPAGYLVTCPAHADGRPSLLLTLKDDGRLLVYCRAGCDRGAVLDALHMEDRDLFGWTPGDGAVHVRTGGPAADPVPTHEIAALRVWLDACEARWAHAEIRRDTATLAQSAEAYLLTRFGMSVRDALRVGVGLSPAGTQDPHRFISPRFRRHPRLVIPMCDFSGVAHGAQGRDLSGQCDVRWVSLANERESSWAWGRYGVFRGDEGRPWVITEGPSDALTVAALGYNVLFIRGAGVAKNERLASELADGLRGKSVVIAADNDKAGHGLRMYVGTALHKRGVPARYLVIPHAGDDITDWRERDPDDFPRAFAQAGLMAERIQPAEPTPTKEEPIIPALPPGPGPDIDPEWKRGLPERLSAIDPGMKLIREVDYAEAVRVLAGDEIRHVPGFGWFRWTGTHWEDGGHKPAFAAMTRAAERLKELQLSDFAHYLRIHQYRKAIAAEMMLDPEMQAPASALNASVRIPFLNGTYDPRSGKFEPDTWYPEDMRTSVVRAHFGRGGATPRWDRFCNEVWPGTPDVADHVMRMLGRALMGDQRHHVFGVWHGHKGRNGKGTITRLMQRLIGDAVVLPDVAMFERRGSRHGEQLARLALAWLVIANETNEGVAMDDELIKRMSGNDTMTFRRNYMSEVEYRPRYTVIFTTNHLPEFTGTDAALWTRARAVEFPISFAGREDVDLDSVLQGEEADAIATAIALAAHRAYRDGVPDTESTAAAKQTHRSGVDPLTQLEGELFVFEESGRMRRSEFNASLQEWRRENGESRTSKYAPRAIANALAERGVTVVQERGIRHFAGIAVPGRSAANTSPNGAENVGNTDARRRIFE